MKKLLIRLGFNLLSKLIKNSIKNDNLLIVLTPILNLSSDIVDDLTDDDKDNSAQVEKTVIEHLPIIFGIAGEFLDKKKS